MTLRRVMVGRFFTSSCWKGGERWQQDIVGFCGTPVPRQYSQRRAKVATQNQIAIDSKMPRGQLKPVNIEKGCFTHDKIEAMVSLL
jgi:hypothetical protein